MMQKKQAEKPITDRYLSLDAMRGVAALLVVVGHFHAAFAGSAHLAVDFFYLLSGFVITEVYTKRLNAGMGVGGFLKQRLLRLYPLYVVGTALGLVQIFALVATHNLKVNFIELGVSAVANLLILPSPVYLIFSHRPGEIYGLFPANGPAWSIFWEFVINIAFAAFLFRARLWVIATAATLGFAGMVAGALHYGSLNIGWEWPSFEGGLARVVFAFSVGILLSRFRQHLPRGQSYFALVPSCLLAIFMMLSVSGQLRILYDLGFCLIAAPLIVCFGIMVEVPKSLSKLCYYAGYISYPIYILHRGVIKIAELVVEKLHLPTIMGVLLLLAGLCVFAFLVATCVDKFTKALFDKSNQKK